MKCEFGALRGRERSWMKGGEADGCTKDPSEWQNCRWARRRNSPERRLLDRGYNQAV